MRRSVALISTLVLALLCSAALGGEAPTAHPAATATTWAATPDIALQNAVAQANELLRINQQLKSAIGWIAWASGAALAILGFAKLIPGPSGAIAEALWGLFANRLQKVAERKNETLSDGFVQVAEIMRQFPKDTPLGDVIDKLQRELPEPVRQAYREWERQHADPRPMTKSEIMQTAKLRAIAEQEVTRSFEHSPTAAPAGQSPLTKS